MPYLRNHFVALYQLLADLEKDKELKKILQMNGKAVMQAAQLN